MTLRKNNIAIIGIVGLPANYGGFETLADNLVKFQKINNLDVNITVYCSKKSYSINPDYYLNAKLKYISLNAHGVQSIFYDFISILSAILNKNDVILVLGVSGALIFPLVRLLSLTRIVVNIDGIEWQRAKWRGLSRYFLLISERIAVMFSHTIIADNDAIADYIRKSYNVDSCVIAYGGDHALSFDSSFVYNFSLPASYAFTLCRIEPENNIHIILKAFSKTKFPLVIVGNWGNSDYGRTLRKKFINYENIYMVDPIYELPHLKFLRESCSIYVHGHSAGGTNPSLVEAMHFRKPILAYDCAYNRSTTENGALYFKNFQDLIRLVMDSDKKLFDYVGCNMLEIARRRYCWSFIARKYFDILT